MSDTLISPRLENYDCTTEHIALLTQGDEKFKAKVNTLVDAYFNEIRALTRQGSKEDYTNTKTWILTEANKSNVSPHDRLEAAMLNLRGLIENSENNQAFCIDCESLDLIIDWLCNIDSFALSCINANTTVQEFGRNLQALTKKYRYRILRIAKSIQRDQPVKNSAPRPISANEQALARIPGVTPPEAQNIAELMNSGKKVDLRNALSGILQLRSEENHLEIDSFMRLIYSKFSGNVAWKQKLFKSVVRKYDRALIPLLTTIPETDTLVTTSREQEEPSSPDLAILARPQQSKKFTTPDLQAMLTKAGIGKF